MKRIISLFLIISIMLSFPACKKSDVDETPGDDSTVEQDPPAPAVPTIVVPEYKDYGRGSADFGDLVYSRPDLEAIIAGFDRVSALVKANETPIGEQIEEIKALESSYTYTESMYAIAEIYSHKDSSLAFWQDEFRYISTNYPSFVRSVEELLVACAGSEHRPEFEDGYFGYSLKEYENGGTYTDTLVELLAEEALKEAEYSALSTANVSISYKSVGGFTFEGTVDEVLLMAEEKYGKDTAEYKNTSVAIDNLYRQKLLALSTPIYIDLLKTRRLIADELGYSDYTEFAYRNMGYEYSEEDMEGLLDCVGRYVAPVTAELNSAVFTTYFQKNNQPRVDTVGMINTTYKAYSRVNTDVLDAYSYMLQHGLFDVSAAASGRYEGAFTAYIDSNNSPYLFMTTSGFLKDYTTLAHELGHFYDAYVNYGDEPSLDLAEVSSQGLELLTLLRLKNELKMTEYEYLEYFTMYNMLNSVLLEQSFFAAFEHMAYELEYDEITAKNLNNAVKDAFSLVYSRELETGTAPLQYVMIPHVILYPHYVESYVVSAIPSLEIFFMESYRTGNAGDGLSAYEKLIKRADTELSFTKQLELAGLSSPFDQEAVKKIANSVYYQISGKNYYTDADTDIEAA